MWYKWQILDTHLEDYVCFSYTSADTKFFFLRGPSILETFKTFLSIKIYIYLHFALCNNFSTRVGNSWRTTNHAYLSDIIPNTSAFFPQTTHSVITQYKHQEWYQVHLGKELFWILVWTNRPGICFSPTPSWKGAIKANSGTIIKGRTQTVFHTAKHWNCKPTTSLWWGLVKRLLPLNPIGWLGQTIALSKYHLGNSEKQHFTSAQALCTWNLDKFITFTMARPWKLWEWCLVHRRKLSRLPYFSLVKWLVFSPTSTLKKTLKNTPTHTKRRQYT